jgi:hypothetical protein
MIMYYQKLQQLSVQVFKFSKFHLATLFKQVSPPTPAAPASAVAVSSSHGLPVALATPSALGVTLSVSRM